MAFVLGATMCAMGVLFLREAGLITGQTAGLAVLLSYLSGAGFGLWFFVVNLPFYVLGWLRMGPLFTIKSFIAVTLVSFFSEALPRYLIIDSVPPWLAALLAGFSIGLGLIVIFRHGASLGGIGVLALWLQDRAGIQAGWVQLGFDVILFGAAVFVLDPWPMLWSLLGAAVANVIVGVNHRKDRYIGR